MKKKLFIIWLFLPFLLLSQEKRPKIGLVLSGGGAKGFAHISVLKAIEKAGIHLDYIGGTSMGAIVGGFYAAGYSADQLEKIIINTNFVNLLKDKLPRKVKPFFEKENGEKHTIELPVNKGIIGFPKGFSKGQSMLNFLTRHLAPVENITNFKKLPIPFFCIATDVSTGEAVLLEKGSLPLSLRASGSFPTLLYPIELDGKLLIDGGLVNNFPVDIMRQKGVDIIIGVDVQGKLAKKEKITSVLAILTQIVSYKMYNNNKKQVKDVDVYLHPNISKFSVVSFDKKIEILKKGALIPSNFYHQLDSIAKLQGVKKVKRQLIEKPNRFLLKKITIKGNKNYTRTYVLGTLKLRIGDTITYKELTKKINYLTATDNFVRIDYSFKNVKEGKKLTLNLTESHVNANIKLGVHYDKLYKSAVLINYNQKHVWQKNDMLSIDLIIGDNLRYNFDYYIDNGFYWSFGFKSRYNTFLTNVKTTRSTNSSLEVNYRDFTNQIYAKTTFDRKLSLGIGFEHKNIFADSKTILDTNGNPTIYDKSNYFNGYSFIKLDTYDDKYFMNHGFFIDLGFKWYIISSNYNKNFQQYSQAKGKIGFATPFSKKLTFKYESEMGFSLGSVTSKVFDFSLGGYNENYINNFVPFYGYKMAGLSEQTFLKSTFLFRYNLVKKQYAIFIANFARVENNVFKRRNFFKNIKSGYVLGYSVDTMLGPIELKYTWSPEIKKSYWLFNLGFWF